jgi:putative membrane protein insertion efficiency factor
MKRVIIILVKLYQKHVSPFLGRNCRFIPSCSEYMIDSVKKYGSLKGTWKGVKRILKCHPFHKGGIDLP